MRRTPLFPASRFSQNDFAPIPMGEITPTPVTTTRLMRIRIVDGCSATASRSDRRVGRHVLRRRDRCYNSVMPQTEPAAPPAPPEEQPSPAPAPQPGPPPAPQPPRGLDPFNPGWPPT